MDAAIASLVAQLGMIGIFVLMAAENIFPPMPSEAIMGSAALAIHHGTMQFWPVLIVGTIGTVAGNYFWFRIGQKWGYERLEPFVARWGRWLTLEWQDIEKASNFFRKHGHWVVLVSRTAPFMRTMISLPAGLAYMNTWVFLLFTAIGAAIWNAILLLGTQWLIGRFGNSGNIISYLLIAVTVLAVAGYIWRFFTWKPRAER
ncbi:DedA family protein [Porphyrobacter algicida]|uniref:DedA family protein n=1 Tax=Qipengyuania algicida TaxID=1836209 RepID=A0A845AFN1_9SPHN|nr:DedA family protein [Qipengyuania algicida]MXP28434.1 DedA family protein [Qipengyuania algicida]